MVITFGRSRVTARCTRPNCGAHFFLRWLRYGNIVTWRHGKTYIDEDMTEETTMHVVLPLDLKRKFKAACVMNGVNMSQVVSQLIQDWMKEGQHIDDGNSLERHEATQLAKERLNHPR